MMHNRPYSPPELKGVIFDMDGTLIDSEPNYYEGDRRLFEKFGIDLTYEMKKPFIGMGNREMIRIMREDYKMDVPADELLQMKIDSYMNVARQNTRPFPKMVKLVELLQKEGIELAVASGSEMSIVEELLEQTGLKKYFSIILSSELVEHSKPYPDVFLECAKRMNIEPRNLAVVEDSRHGVEAGVRAGMRVLAIPSIPDPPLHPTFQMADLLIEKGMDDFDSQKALKWLLNQ